MVGHNTGTAKRCEFFARQGTSEASIERHVRTCTHHAMETAPGRIS